MIARMRIRLLALSILFSTWHASAFAQCAPAPDSSYFFRDLAAHRADAKIAGNQAFYDGLLSDAFAAKGNDGKPVDKHEFIERELTPSDVAPPKHFYAIRDFTLVERRKGFVVSSYLLTEGMTERGETRASEARVREVYQVEDGKWRLTSVEAAAP